MADEIKDENKDKPVASDEQSKAKKAKKGKAKEPGKVRRWMKDFVTELKKVTWPTFPKVLKQTGIVLLVTVCFLVIMLGFDLLFGYLNRLLISGLKDESVALVYNAVSDYINGGGGLLL